MNQEADSKASKRRQKRARKAQARANRLAARQAKRADKAKNRYAKAVEEQRRRLEKARTRAQKQIERALARKLAAEKRMLRREERRKSWRKFFRLRVEPSPVVTGVAAGLMIVLILGVWTYVTWGDPSVRIMKITTLQSPLEHLQSFKVLWFERELTRNIVVSMRRIAMGFGLAVAVGIPIGVLCGAWRPFGAFVAPVSVFGRNVPIAALIPLTMMFFGIDETQKIMFIFIACVMFLVFDSARAIRDVHQKYVDTAHTLGASRTQILFKVLIPLAAPDIFNSIRLLLGLAFGYIILAEIVNMNEGGLGAMIAISQRRPKFLPHITIILMVMTLLAFTIDRILMGLSGWLFPHRRTR